MTDIYVTKSGQLSRKDNSLIFSNDEIKRTIPVKDINAIFVLSEITLNTRLLQFLSQCQIAVYFYNHYGFFIGQFAPRKKAVSGRLLVAQVEHYKDNEKRLNIAKEFLNSAIHNMRKTLMQYNLSDSAEKIGGFVKKIEYKKTINDLMLTEAEAREFYYKQYNKIINNKEFEFLKRTRQPPDNYINTLISFGNSLLYNTILSEIFKTQIDPTVSFLHEPFERRYSLNLDIAEIFKPLIVDRVIFSLINRKQIVPEHFDKEVNYCYLNDEGRKVFLKEYDSKMSSTLKYPALNRKVSYRYMLRLECYKLIKHFLEGRSYKGFRIYW